jgi:PAS domain-containing protein
MEQGKNMEPSNNDMLVRTLFDAFPALVFAVDEDARIVESNAAAADFIGKDRKIILGHRGGEAFDCLHAYDVPEGCGRGLLCKDCVLRNSIKDAFQGNSTIRSRTKMEIIRGDKVIEIYALITVSMFIYQGRQLAMLVIEDISELIELQRVIPICMRCKKVRSDKEYWLSVESYLKTHLDMDFSHTFCPECGAKEMDKLDKELK